MPNFSLECILLGKEMKLMHPLLAFSGYMSPEYAMEGLFSEKSDVFSFGVLLLEIVSSKKNSKFLEDESLSLLTYVRITHYAKFPDFYILSISKCDN